MLKKFAFRAKVFEKPADTIGEQDKKPADRYNNQALIQEHNKLSQANQVPQGVL